MDPTDYIKQRRRDNAEHAIWLSLNDAEQFAALMDIFYFEATEAQWQALNEAIRHGLNRVQEKEQSPMNDLYEALIDQVVEEGKWLKQQE